MVATAGTDQARNAPGQAVGLANHTSFLRPVSEGVVKAEARVVHAGRTTWVWEIEMSDGQGRRCAVSRVTVAIRRPRADS